MRWETAGDLANWPSPTDHPFPEPILFPDSPTLTQLRRPIPSQDGSGSTSAPMTCPTGKVYDPSKSASYCEGAKCTTTSTADVASCCLDTTYSPKTYVPTKHVKVLHGFFHYGGKDVFDPMDTDYQVRRTITYAKLLQNVYKAPPSPPRLPATQP